MSLNNVPSISVKRNMHFCSWRRVSRKALFGTLLILIGTIYTYVSIKYLGYSTKFGYYIHYDDIKETVAEMGDVTGNLSTNKSSIDSDIDGNKSHIDNINVVKISDIRHKMNGVDSMDINIDKTNDNKITNNIYKTNVYISEANIGRTNKEMSEFNTDITNGEKNETELDGTAGENINTNVNSTDTEIFAATVKMTDTENSETNIKMIDKENSETNVEMTDKENREANVGMTDTENSEASVEMTYTENSETKVEMTDKENSETNVEMTDAENSETNVKMTDTENSETNVEMTDAENSETNVEMTDAENSETNVEMTDTENSETNVEMTDKENSEANVGMTDKENRETNVEMTDKENSETNVGMSGTENSETNVEETNVEMTDTENSETNVEITDKENSEANVGMTDTENSETNVKSTDTENSETNVDRTDKGNSETKFESTDTENIESNVEMTDTENSETNNDRTDKKNSETNVESTDTENNETNVDKTDEAKSETNFEIMDVEKADGNFDIDNSSEVVGKKVIGSVRPNDSPAVNFKSTILTDITSIRTFTGNVFFVETRCVTKKAAESYQESRNFVLNARQCCAVESTARMNPDRPIYVFHSCPLGDDFIAISAPFVGRLLNYENVHIVRLIPEEVFRGTPVEGMFARGDLEASVFPVEHASDLLRYTLLWKFGGTYLDLDFVTIKPLSPLGSNWAGEEFARSINGAVLNVAPEGAAHQMMGEALATLNDHFDGEAWANNGPILLTRLVLNYCQVQTVDDAVANCHANFTVLPRSYVYPLGPWQINDYFNEVLGPSLLAELKYNRNTYCVHAWNKLTHGMVATRGTKQLYALLAAEFCPAVYANCGKHF